MQGRRKDPRKRARTTCKDEEVKPTVGIEGVRDSEHPEQNHLQTPQLAFSSGRTPFVLAARSAT